MLSVREKKQRLAEIDLTIKNSERLILQTLSSLGITYEQFRLLINNTNNQNYLN